MALPVVVSVGALTATAGGAGSQTVALPLGLAVNHVLLMQIASAPSAPVAGIGNAAGGTWSYVEPLFSGSEAGPGIRATWIWSRYNGTQTAPTIADNGSAQIARIVAVNGCVTTGSPIHVQAGSAPTFAETTSTIPSVTTTSNDCLIIDGICADGPDASGTGLFGTWGNATLTTQTEHFDDSSTVGTGLAFAMQSGGLHTQGAAGATTVVHGSQRVAYKKLALTPAVVSTMRFDKNARGQILIDGVPRLPLLIYDGGLPQFTSGYPAYLATDRGMARFTNKIDIYLNVQNGTLGNSLRFADALGLYNMYALTTGNALVVFDLPIPGPTGKDVHDNPTVSVPPVPAGPFRTQWAAHSRAFGTYLWDEPSHGPSFSGNGSRTLFTAQGRPTVFTPPDFVVKVNGVQKTLNVDFTVTTHANAFNDGQSGNIQGPNYTLTFAVAPPSGTFNIPVRFRYVFESMMYYHAQLKSQMPEQFTFGTLLNGDLGQYIEWADDPIGDTIGSDIYVIGQGPESGTGASYGYMNFNVGEVAAMARYYALLNNKTPNIILQFNHFGASSRFITASEIRSHCIAALTEFKGRGLIGWWALGIQQGAIHQTNFNSQTANGTNTTFFYNSRVDFAEDVWVDVNGQRLNANQFTVNGMAQDPPYTVTLNVAPPAGQNVTVSNNSVGLVTRELWLSTLETLTTMIKTLEPIMLTPDNPSLITSNSTWVASPIAWRISLLQLLVIGGDRPTWLEGLRLLYVDELSRLQQVPPDTSLSDYLVTGEGQRGNVRTASWEVGNVGIVCAYNMHPNAQPGVTFEWHADINSVEVLGENRTIPVNAGRRWVDTFGGGSAKQQGLFDQGHVYRLTLGGTTITHYTMAAAGGTYTYTGATTVLTQIAGPTTVGFIWSR